MDDIRAETKRSPRWRGRGRQNFGECRYRGALAEQFGILLSGYRTVLKYLDAAGSKLMTRNFPKARDLGRMIGGGGGGEGQVRKWKYILSQAFGDFVNILRFETRGCSAIESQIL